MLPKVIVSNEISLDGSIHGFEVNQGRYYGLVAQLGVDSMLTGSETAWTAAIDYPEEKPEDFQKPPVEPDDPRPACVITDSRGRLRNLHVFRAFPYFKNVIILVSRTTPPSYLEYLDARHYDYVVAGEDRINYREALQALYDRHSVRSIVTDSGGQLVSYLIRDGLVDEIALVIDPVLVGTTHTPLFRHLHLENSAARLNLISVEAVDSDWVYVRYRVIK